VTAAGGSGAGAPAGASGACGAADQGGPDPRAEVRAARAARAERARATAVSRAGILAARDLVEVRFGGSGGQGVILMGVILAMAGARDHRFVVQTQSYGPEARGGYSRSDVIISDSQIDYPELQQADLLVALSQAAADEYVRVLRSDGVLVYDSENVTALPPFAGERYGIPFTRLALGETGRKQTTNILTLGAVVGITGVVTTEALRRAMLAMVPAGTEDVNSKALARGLALDATEWRSAATGL
jgi:2-oxoglutarate ferredoxin oxidoreductase subunit gamma